MVAVLQRRADFLVEEYYNGYTVESIQADVQSLLQDLSNTNSTLQTITLDVSSVQALQDILLEVRYLSYCRNLRTSSNCLLDSHTAFTWYLYSGKASLYI